MDQCKTPAAKVKTDSSYFTHIYVPSFFLNKSSREKNENMKEKSSTYRETKLKGNLPYLLRGDREQAKLG